MPIIDISPSVSTASPVFPGDTAFTSETTASIDDGSSVNVSRIAMSVHVGAHADAPLHYDRGGVSIDAVPLGDYIGPCTVIHLLGAGEEITRDAVAKGLEACGHALEPRVLIRTYDEQPQRWDENFSAISAETINWLAERRVRLIGVDTPSLDPASSKALHAHKAVARHDMRILENLDLTHAPPGRYELIAPPLKLAGLDAAPVRALLRTLSS